MLNYALEEMVQVVVTKTGGGLHRRWVARVERVSSDHLVLMSPLGTPVRLPARAYLQKYHIRSHYWPGKHYNLVEFYHPDGRLALLYSDVCSAVEFDTGRITFVDHELDAAFWTGGSPEIVDEDEFAEAIVHYGYSAELQRQCWAAAAEALEVVSHWHPAGINLSASSRS